MSDCILWTKAKDKAGYGVSWFNGKWIRAHVKAWYESGRKLASYEIVCHKCDNRDCVNPEHLISGTPAYNSKDMVSKNRQARGEKCGNSKLTEKEVLEIRTAEGSLREIAKQYNISKTNVGDIKRRYTWRHI